MPRAEALAAFLAESAGSRLIQERPRLLVMESDTSAEDTLRIVSRLGLSHDASEFLFGTPWEPVALKRAASDARLPRGIRFAVRAERLGQNGPRRTTVEKD